MSMRKVSPFGHRLVDSAGAAVHSSVATISALTALATTDLAHGDEAMLESDFSNWYWHSTSTLTEDSILVAGTATAGRWLRKPGAAILKLPIAFGTADNATILTVPTGCVFLLHRAFWDITTAFAGGSSSAIAIDSDLTGFSTAGDILGGASGDVEATLTAGIKAGTVGTGLDTEAEAHAGIFQATKVIRLQRVTSAFTSGAGFACLCVTIYKNAGA